MTASPETVTPDMRFPEFRDATGWEEKSLNEVCDGIHQGGTPDTSNPDYWDGDLPWLTPAEMGNLKSRFVNSTKRNLSHEGLRNCSSKLLPINSIILSTRAPIGYLAINLVEMAFNQGCRALVPSKQILTDFLYYYLSTKKIELNNLGAGSTFKELTGSILRNLKLAIPNTIEQQRIADCLSSIDELIAIAEQKLQTLRDHKQGLMQQLFPAAGETHPALRFPEFHGTQGWGMKSMASIVTEVFSGGTPLSDEEKYYQGDIPFIRSAEINNTKTKLHLTEKGLQESSATLVETGDLLVAMYGANSGNVAISKISGAINQAILCIRTTGSNAFVYQYLNHKKKHITLKYLQGGQGNLSASIIKTIRIPTPKKNEQQRIADCLSSVDSIIATIEQRLATLRGHKQGLMQQLFPR